MYIFMCVYMYVCVTIHTWKHSTARGTAPRKQSILSGHEFEGAMNVKGRVGWVSSVDLHMHIYIYI